MQKKQVYLKSFTEATSAGEERFYHESKGLNLECATAIDKAIHDCHVSNGYYDYETAVRSIINEYGEERTAFVLVVHIRNEDYDSRFSDTNKEWAVSSDIPYDKNHARIIRLHSFPVLLDCFTEHFRQILLRERKSMYRVKITETLTMTVGIEAENESYAEQEAKDRWNNSEYVLDSEHFTDVTFEVVDNNDIADTTVAFNTQRNECIAIWEKYLQYLVDWVHSHREVEFKGMNPAGYDERYSNEYLEELEGEK